MKQLIIDGNQILWGDKTVWVNNNQGECIGRFSFIFGMDVHKSNKQKKEQGDSECLYCTHGKEDFDGFLMFVDKMKEFHNISIPKDLFGI